MPSPNYIESPNATIRQSCIFSFQIEKAFSVGHSICMLWTNKVASHAFYYTYYAGITLYAIRAKNSTYYSKIMPA